MPFGHDPGEACLPEPVGDRPDRGKPRRIGGGHPGNEALRDPAGHVSWRDRSHQHQAAHPQNAEGFGDCGARVGELMQHKREQDAIEGRGAEGELFGVPDHPAHCPYSQPGKLLGEGVKRSARS
jgi:hypothetical protein